MYLSDSHWLLVPIRGAKNLKFSPLCMRSNVSAGWQVLRIWVIRISPVQILYLFEATYLNIHVFEEIIRIFKRTYFSFIQDDIFCNIRIFPENIHSFENPYFSSQCVFFLHTNSYLFQRNYAYFWSHNPYLYIFFNFENLTPFICSVIIFLRKFCLW